MIPNNNLSVLPWYSSIEQQNARKWWVYGRIYPLFTPAGFLLPFQVMRDHLSEFIYEPDGDALIEEQTYLNSYLNYDGDDYSILGSMDNRNSVAKYEIEGLGQLYFDNLPGVNPASEPPGANVLFVDSEDNITGHYILSADSGSFTGGIDIPEDSVYVYIQRSTVGYTGAATVYAGKIVERIFPITKFEIYDKDGGLVGDYSSRIIPQINIKYVEGIDVIVYIGLLPFESSFANGQYYAKMTDGVNTWYSEIFTVVNDIEPYLKITWWDEEDFVMDAGVIVYREPPFKNVLYLKADIAKPEYVFEEEGETRDGYFFPVKQISEKKYKFGFIASEYLLDVMRFIRMADYAQITKNGQTWNLDTFLITPEWESNGDVANVSAEFETATVAKKIGMIHTPGSRGDFNKDFNKDFNN